MPLELIVLVLEELQPPELLSLMQTCRALRDTAGSALHRHHFTPGILPRLFRRLLDTVGLGKDETTPKEAQQVVLAALQAQTQHSGWDNYDSGCGAYLEAPEAPVCFRMPRDPGATSHVNQAFWKCNVSLLHVAALAGADDVARFLWETGGDVNAKTKVDDIKKRRELLAETTPLELAIVYNRASTVNILLGAGAIIGRSWELALDGGRPEMVRLLLEHDRDIANRIIPSDVGPPTVGTFLYHRHGWELAGRVYRAPSATLVSELIRAGADMHFKWNWDGDETDKSLVRAVQLHWDDVALVLASEWSGQTDLDQMLMCQWDSGQKPLVRRCVDKMRARGITPSANASRSIAEVICDNSSTVYGAAGFPFNP
ncbi:hypothetical protein CPLU01_09863 [Colletotrichum plurivorum]|uniref:F-box domain-containing protein n=1 Tax=Colletotrichum plurivorum TaxID=2175906 RepID=A0A8H6K805_9PEZI|nr:hypothetical protein CPLU01_09863 [Colletotrichum plurivorum]